MVPLIIVPGTVGLGKDGREFSILPIFVERGQPSFTGFRIVHPVDAPVLLTGKILRKVQEQIVTRHGPTSEKVVTHPTTGEFFRPSI